MDACERRLTAMLLQSRDPREVRDARIAWYRQEVHQRTGSRLVEHLADQIRILSEHAATFVEHIPGVELADFDIGVWLAEACSILTDRAQDPATAPAAELAKRLATDLLTRAPSDRARPELARLVNLTGVFLGILIREGLSWRGDFRAHVEAWQQTMLDRLELPSAAAASAADVLTALTAFEVPPRIGPAYISRRGRLVEELAAAMGSTAREQVLVRFHREALVGLPPKDEWPINAGSLWS